MTAIAPAAAWLWAVALGSVAVDTEARLAARGRDIRVEGAEVRRTAELEVVPRFALVRQGRLALSLSYAPRLTLPVDLSAGAPELTSGAAFRDSGEVLHRADAAAEVGATPNLTLRLRSDAAYGRIDLLRSSVYADEVVPTAGRLRWRSIRASVGATATPRRLTTVSGALGAFETGGADAAAREIAPLQRGARLEGAIRHAISRRDELALSLDGSYSRMTRRVAAGEAAVVRLGGGWARVLAPTLAARVAAGPAWSYSDAPGTAGTRDMAAFAEAVLTHTVAQPLVSTELAVRSGPYTTPLTGAVHQRLEASVATAWSPFREWSLGGRAAVAATRSDTSGAALWSGAREAEVASADARATWAFARRGSLSLGPRVRWQWSHDPSLPTFSDWGAAVELAVGARWPR